MDEDGLTIYDIENAILTGKIIEKQKDRETKEAKYLVYGEAVNRSKILVAVTKFGILGTLIIITVYVE